MHIQTFNAGNKFCFIDGVVVFETDAQRDALVATLTDPSAAEERAMAQNDERFKDGDPEDYEYHVEFAEADLDDDERAALLARGAHVEMTSSGGNG